MATNGTAAAAFAQLESVNALIEAAGKGLEELIRRLAREIGPDCSATVVDRLGGQLCTVSEQSRLSDSELLAACEQLWGTRSSAVAKSEAGTVLLQTLGVDVDFALVIELQTEPSLRSRSLVNTAARLASTLIGVRHRVRKAAAAVDGAVLALLLEHESGKATAVATTRGGLPPDLIRIYLAGGDVRQSAG
ncbi:hypothetical protein ACFZAV_41680 [Streptomyces sp. NPDC008343]|uniref:hypothetical protein n=1 Tax=Streptomyces sp. NPDC008343 TaxID=3364828 RepID=UPI0036E60417